MNHTHFPEEDVQDALESYRAALDDAVQELGVQVTKEEIIVLARVMLEEDDADQHELIVSLSASEYGDPVWSLEEEMLDDLETVASSDDDAEDGDDSEDDEDDV